MPPQPMVVTKAAPGSWAEHAGIHIGDEVIQVNGTPVPQLAEQDFKKAMHPNNRPITLRIRRWQEEQPKPVQYKLKVKIVGAKGLRNADTTSGGWYKAKDKGFSDPYCVCEIVGKPDKKISTPAIQDDLNPVWNHQGAFPVFEETDELFFQVFDEDEHDNHEALGDVTLKAKEFIPDGFKGDIALLNAGEGIKAVLQLRIAATEIVPEHGEEGPAVKVHPSEAGAHKEKEKARREEEAQREAAATKLQSAQRGKVARQQVNAKRAERDAARPEPRARQEPAAAQENAACEEAFDPAETARREAAATKLQSAERGKAARKRVNNLKEEKKSKERPAAKEEAAPPEVVEQERRVNDLAAEDAKREAAATKIQSMQRGKAERKKVNNFKEEKKSREQIRQEQLEEERRLYEAKREAAATKIQSTQRGKAARRQVDGRRQEEQQRKAKAKPGQEEEAAIDQEAPGEDPDIVLPHQLGYKRPVEEDEAMEEAEVDEEDPEATRIADEKDRAATKLQAAQRGKAARQRVETLRAERDSQGAVDSDDEALAQEATLQTSVLQRGYEREDAVASPIRIKIFSAKSLPQKGKDGAQLGSESFVLARLLGKPGCEFKTKGAKPTHMATHWNETATMLEAVSSDVVELFVYGHDARAQVDHFLGRATIAASTWMENWETDKRGKYYRSDLKLDGRTTTQASTLSIEIRPEKDERQRIKRFKDAEELTPPATPRALKAAQKDSNVLVTVVSAHNLERVRPWEKNQRAQLYVIVRSASGAEAKTELISDTLEPVWNLTKAVPGELGSVVEFLLYAKDEAAADDDLIGSAAMQVRPNGNKGMLELINGFSSSDRPKAFLQVCVKPFSDIDEAQAGEKGEADSAEAEAARLAAEPAAKDGATKGAAGQEATEDEYTGPQWKLNVTVIGATGIKKAGTSGKTSKLKDSGTTDPYCSVQILGRPEQCFLTRAVHNSMNPLFNHEDVIYEAREKDELLVQIFDNDEGAAEHELLGDLIIPAEQFLPDGFEGELPLQNADSSGEACLEVRILATEIKDFDASMAEAASAASDEEAEDAAAAEGEKAGTPGSEGPTVVANVHKRDSATQPLPKKDSVPASTLPPETVIGTDPDSNEHVRWFLEWPRMMWIKAPNDNYHEPISGFYRLVEGRRPGGLPLWKQLMMEHETKHYIFSSASNHWMIGSQEEEEQGFFCDSGVAATRAPHGGTPQNPMAAKMPDQMEGLWQMFHQGQWHDAFSLIVDRGQPANSVRVHIESAMHLPKPETKNRADSFCLCKLLPGGRAKPVRTDVCFSTLNPRWNHSDVLNDYHRGDDVEFTVYDCSEQSLETYLGRCVVKGELFEGKTEGFSGTLVLEKMGKSTGAALQVKIEVLGPPPPNIMTACPEIRDYVLALCVKHAKPQHEGGGGRADATLRSVAQDYLGRTMSANGDGEHLRDFELIYFLRREVQVKASEVPDSRIRELCMALDVNKRGMIPVTTFLDWLVWTWREDAVPEKPKIVMTQLMTKAQAVMRDGMNLEAPPPEGRRANWARRMMVIFEDTWDKYKVDAIEDFEFIYVVRRQLQIMPETLSDNDLMEVFRALDFETTGKLQVQQIIFFLDPVLDAEIQAWKAMEEDAQHDEELLEVRKRLAHQHYKPLGVEQALRHRREKELLTERHNKMLGLVDVNGDGDLTMEEYIQAHARKGVDNKHLEQTFRTLQKLKGDDNPDAKLQIADLVAFEMDDGAGGDFSTRSPSPMNSPRSQPGGDAHFATMGKDAASGSDVRYDPLSAYDLSALEKFKQLLLKREPSVACAWRRWLDPNWQMRLTKQEFCRACRSFDSVALSGDALKSAWAEMDTDNHGFVTLAELDWDSSELLGHFFEEVVAKFGHVDQAHDAFGLNRGAKLQYRDWMKLLQRNKLASCPDAEKLFWMLCDGGDMPVPHICSDGFQWLDCVIGSLELPSLNRVMPGSLGADDEQMKDQLLQKRHAVNDGWTEWEMRQPVREREQDFFERLHDSSVRKQRRLRAQHSEKHPSYQPEPQPRRISQYALGRTFERLHKDGERKAERREQMEREAHHQRKAQSRGACQRTRDPEVFQRLTAARQPPRAVSQPVTTREVEVDPEAQERTVNRLFKDRERREGRRRELIERKEKKDAEEAKALANKFHKPENFTEEVFERNYREEYRRTEKRNQYLQRTKMKQDAEFEKQFSQKWKGHVRQETFYRLYIDGIDRHQQREDAKRAREMEEMSRLHAESVHSRVQKSDGNVFERLHTNYGRQTEATSAYDFSMDSIGQLTPDAPWEQSEDVEPPPEPEPVAPSREEKGKGKEKGSTAAKGKAGTGGAARGTMVGGGGKAAKGGGGAARGTMVGGGGKGKAGGGGAARGTMVGGGGKGK
eukprot:TRINITY_DN30891_c0_g3_i1.p1 TRINITY_DN30891_c0_g3~~TRINITY_DN30891_c0_g3_i1.p1  ORF type:complete len:2524 (-),score=786.84 TRINITY_DN30891_c0_g3_i1:106-7218(-)